MLYSVHHHAFISWVLLSTLISAEGKFILGEMVATAHAQVEGPLFSQLEVATNCLTCNMLRRKISMVATTPVSGEHLASTSRTGPSLHVS